MMVSPYNQVTVREHNVIDTREDIKDILVKVFGDIHITSYIVDLLTQANDQEARVFHTSLRGAWSYYDESNKPQYIQNTPASVILRKKDDSNDEHYNYKLCGGYLVNVKPRKYKGYGWKMKTMPYDLLRELQFQNPELYCGLTILQRKPDVGKYKCSERALYWHNEYIDGYAEMLVDDIMGQVKKTLKDVSFKYAMMMEDFMETESQENLLHNGPVLKLTLDKDYDLWVTYALDDKKNEFYGITVSNKSSKNPYYGDYDTDDEDEDEDENKEIFSTEGLIVNGKVIFDRTQTDIAMDVGIGDIVAEYTKEQLIQEFGPLWDEIEDVGDFLKARFNFDIHNSALYELCVHKMKYMTEDVKYLRDSGYSDDIYGYAYHHERLRSQNTWFDFESRRCIHVDGKVWKFL